MVSQYREKKRLYFIYHINKDFLDLKAKDDGPNQAKDQPRVAIYNIFSTNVFKIDLKQTQKKND